MLGKCHSGSVESTKLTGREICQLTSQDDQPVVLVFADAAESLQAQGTGNRKDSDDATKDSGQHGLHGEGCDPRPSGAF